MNGMIRIFAVLIGGTLVLSACDSNGIKLSEKKVPYDTLFLGFSFGMEKQQFFDYCWEMNKQKKFIHGTGNMSVEYRLEDELDEVVIMRFYPSFHDDKIYEMPVLFTYEKWAPWNKQYWSDTLLREMIKVFKKWYGDDFQVINHPVQGTVFAKIDGSRRINLFIKDDQFVQAVFTDLKVEQEKNETASN